MKQKKLIGFFDFIREQGVIGLALGFILGGAVSKVVSSLVEDIVNPILGLALGFADGLYTVKLTIDDADIMIGRFIGILIDFVVIALVVYVIFRVLGLEKIESKKSK